MTASLDYCRTTATFKPHTGLHPPKILCPVCLRMEAMPVGPGMPECSCSTEGVGPCKTAVCLHCFNPRRDD